MKSPFALPAGLAMLLALSACGQTGPLYMPHRPPPVAVPAATATPPAPAAGTAGPAAGSNANNTQATQSTPATNPPAPASSQQ